MGVGYRDDYFFILLGMMEAILHGVGMCFTGFRIFHGLQLVQGVLRISLSCAAEGMLAKDGMDICQRARSS